MLFKIKLVIASRAGVPMPRAIFSAVFCYLVCNTFSIRFFATFTNCFCCACCHSAITIGCLGVATICFASSGVRAVAIAYPLAPIVYMIVNLLDVINNMLPFDHYRLLLDLAPLPYLMYAHKEIEQAPNLDCFQQP